jgi:hypothetical protein
LGYTVNGIGCIKVLEFVCYPSHYYQKLVDLGGNVVL